ncbi:hypothetical protein LTS13_006211 [Exophiala xenobiotica]|nr:hypothetical protein LTS13_006211 [Exophiala xenobiotica]KAK5502732.1 hypothetical protein LTR83_002829 [Exophiala xenobiotica]
MRSSQSIPLTTSTARYVGLKRGHRYHMGILLRDQNLTLVTEGSVMRSSQSTPLTTSKAMLCNEVISEHSSHDVDLHPASDPPVSERDRFTIAPKDAKRIRDVISGETQPSPSPKSPASIYGKASLESSRPALKDSHSSTPRRPQWVRSTSGSIWFQKNKSSTETSGRPPSNVSVPTLTESGQLAIRTDLTPLKPPTARRSSSVRGMSSSSIKVETTFTEQRQRSRNASSLTGQTREATVATSSRRSSINPKQIFSAPLLLIRRASLPKRRSKLKSSSAKVPSPDARPPRLADHSTIPKRNHTFEALQRVSAILHDTTKQESKSSPSNSLLPLPLVKPLNRTFSDKSITSTERRSPQIEQGIVSQYTIYQRQKSVERFSSPQSYTSSQVDLRMGLQPTNTPEERATYKIKRSASAESEEFLKVDISIRGGTSYLPSEARRIQTPPLPEEGADGKWRGFFFDYNAPRADSDIQGTELLSSGNTSSANAGEESEGITPNSVKALGRTKTNRSRRVVTGDWYDVRLKQFDVGQDPSQVSDPKSGEKRLNSPDLFEKSPPDWDKEQFDLTIPEHLPSSPLCPRHPRYWRVVKGRGSQFRGCWMHGVGLDESRV